MNYFFIKEELKLKFNKYNIFFHNQILLKTFAKKN